MKKNGPNSENVSQAVLRLGTKQWRLRAPLTILQPWDHATTPDSPSTVTTIITTMITTMMTSVPAMLSHFKHFPSSFTTPPSLRSPPPRRYGTFLFLLFCGFFHVMIYRPQKCSPFSPFFPLPFLSPFPLPFLSSIPETHPSFAFPYPSIPQ